MELKIDEITKEALEKTRNQEIVLGEDIDKTEGGMTPDAFDKKMHVAKDLEDKIPPEKVPPEKKGIFEKLKNTFSTFVANIEKKKLEKADTKIQSHAGLKRWLEKAQGNPDMILALRKWVAMFPDEDTYYIKYNETKKEFEENSTSDAVTF